MNLSPSSIRLSASSIKLLTQCSLAFYYEKVLKMPTREWPKTVVGSMTHSLLECLRHPRHRHHYDAIVGLAELNKCVYYERSPAVARLVRMWQRKHNISDELIADLNGMLYVALVLIDFHWTGANKDAVTGQPITHGPEHEFILVLDDGTQIKGFIDDMAEVGELMVIRDYKTAKQKPTVDETVSSIQAWVYQLYVWKRFKKLARVEFVYLRHPPTARTPMKYLMVTQPSSPEQLMGLEYYLSSLYPQIKSFGLEQGMSQPNSDFGFCRNVCTHYAPHPYWVIYKDTDRDSGSFIPVSSHLSLDKATSSVQNGQHIVEKRHEGCMARWRG